MIKMNELEILDTGGLFQGNSNPFYCIKIPAEKFKELKNREVEVFRTEDRIYFDIVDKEGDNVGDKALFLIWR